MRKLLIAWCLAAGLAQPPAALAGDICNACSVANINVWVSVVKSNLEIAAAWATSMAVQVSAWMSASTQIHSDLERMNVVNKTLAEAKVDALNLYQLQVHAFDLERDFANTTACDTGEIADAITQAGAKSMDEVKKLAGTQLARGMHSASAANVVSLEYKAHLADYCSSEDVLRGRCQQAAAHDLQNADLRASTLFEPNDSVTYGEKERAAAKIMVNSIIDPIPLPAIPVKWEDSAQGKAFVAAQVMRQRRLDISGYGLSTIMSARTGKQDL